MTELKDARDMTKTQYDTAKREILGLRNFSNRDRPVNDSTGDSLLQSAALNAGIVDLDALKLADLTNVNLNDKGEVKALIGSLKKSKPHLFGGKGAMSMTDAEWRAERRRLSEIKS